MSGLSKTDQLKKALAQVIPDLPDKETAMVTAFLEMLLLRSRPDLVKILKGEELQSF